MYKSLFMTITVAIFALFANSRAEDETQKIDGLEFVYSTYSEVYYIKKNRTLSFEMSLRETILNNLLASINNELSLRRREDPNLVRSILNSNEYNTLTTSSLDSNDYVGLSASQFYKIRKDKDLEELKSKYTAAIIVKERLVTSADANQRMRMFTKDLEKAILTYSVGNFEEAILHFDEAITRYDYPDNAAVYFYRAESYYALKFFERAVEDYVKTYSIPSNSDEYARQSLEKLLKIASSFENVSDILRFYNEYKDRFSQVGDASYWNIVFTAGQGLMSCEIYSDALDIFETIPSKHPQYYPAQLLAAQCAISLLDLEKAEDKVYEITYAPGRSVNKQMREHAKLLNGDIMFLHGEFELAFVHYNSVKQISGNDEVLEKAYIGMAWSLYRLGAYKQAIQMCDNFTEKFPKSSLHFELLSLRGYCYELIQGEDESVEQYNHIIKAIDDRQEYRDFNAEQRAIEELGMRAKLFEEYIFEENRSDLFTEYLDFTRRVVRLQDRLRINIASKNYPDIVGLLDEQKNLMALYDELDQLEAEVDDANRSLMFNEFRLARQELMNVILDAKHTFQFLVTDEVLVQKEEKLLMKNAQRDTLRSQSYAELKELESIINSTAELNASNGIKGDVYALQYNALINREILLSVERDLYGKPAPKINSHLDEWSDFAYQRYAYKGLDFDGYLVKGNDVRSLDAQINFINSRLMLSRRSVVSEADSADVALVESIMKQQEAYKANPIPMWDYSKLPFREIDQKWGYIPGSSTPTSKEVEPMLEPIEIEEVPEGAPVPDDSMNENKLFDTPEEELE